MDSMTLELKDIFYLLTYSITVLSLFFSFKNRLTSMEKELVRSQRIIYGKQGGLNLIDHKTCKDHRDVVFAAIRRSETAMEATLKKIDDLNRNVLTIMIHLQIPPVPSPCGDDRGGVP